MSRRSLGWLVVASAAGVLACGGEGDSIAVAAQGSPAAEPDAERAAYTLVNEALAAIGYVDFAAADGLPSGVVAHDEARASPGYNLYVSIPFGMALLVDMRGALVHRWEADEEVQWTRAHLLPDGRLIVLGAEAGDERLECRAWSGERLWRRDLPAHHDFRVLPDGGLLVLTRHVEPHPELGLQGPLEDNRVARLDATGAVVEEVSVLEAWRASPHAADLAGIARVEPNRLGVVDAFHCNSLETMRPCDGAPASPLYSEDNVLLSVRHQSSLVVLDTRRQEVVWSWGRGELQAQHEATLLDSGRILVFDNGTRARGWSRIVELDPVRRQITWQWTAPEPRTFFSGGRGTAQGLPNGNVLVGHSEGGEAFEVARDGEIVWRFRNPQCNEDGSRGSLRIRRYEPEYVEGIKGSVARR